MGAYAQLNKLVTDEIADVINSRLNAELICELRIRNGAPISVRYDGAFYFLCRSGITKDKSAAIVAGAREAENIVQRACERSLYTVNDTLKRGFISVGGGVRIGVCGSGVVSDGTILAVKDFTSVNIRIPHEVRGCAAGIFGRIINDGGVRNTLIISPPGAGKTTMLRDLCRIASDKRYNVLLCDEKYEIAAAACGMPTLDVGCCTDVVSGTDKRSVFESGIAHMRPDIIMTDELFGSDAKYVLRAATCGIAVVATAHARSLDDIRSKPEFVELLESGAFSRFAVIADAPRRSVDVYDGEGHVV